MNLSQTNIFKNDTGNTREYFQMYMDLFSLNNVTWVLLGPPGRRFVLFCFLDLKKNCL